MPRKQYLKIRAVTEDRRAHHLGGFHLALDVWDGAIISMLYTNAEAWGILPKKSMKLLDDLHILSYRSLLRSASGSPKTNYYWQLGLLTPSNIVLQRQLIFAFHLANLLEESLGRSFFDRMESHGLNGLIKDLAEHLDKLNFSTNRFMSKWSWRKLVK